MAFKRKAEKLVLTVSDQLSAVVAISSLDLVDFVFYLELMHSIPLNASFVFF